MAITAPYSDGIRYIEHKRRSPIGQGLTIGERDYDVMLITNDDARFGSVSIGSVLMLRQGTAQVLFLHDIVNKQSNALFRLSNVASIRHGKTHTPINNIQSTLSHHARTWYLVTCRSSLNQSIFLLFE